MEKKRAELSEEFAAFWLSYPHRVGKIAARRAYDKARRLVNADDILAGVDRYIQRKPSWQSWAHPSTWLNGGRWMDDTKAGSSGSSVCPHDPRCRTFAECHQRIFTERSI